MRSPNRPPCFGAAALLLLPCLLPASEPTPAGHWIAVDDHSGKPRGIVRIYQQNGQFFGAIEAAFNPREAKERCEKCSGERKDQPVLGLLIMRGIRKNGDEYSGGDILDPDTGSVYRCKMRLSADGGQLTVRGYIGIPLLGRTQMWIREP